MALVNDQFPTVHNCDVNDPEERFLPYLVGLPGMRGAPLPFPVSYLRQVSQRISDAMTDELRAALALEHPTIKYRQPRSDSPHWMADPGTWVAIDEPDPEGPNVKQFVQSLPAQERVAIATELGLRDVVDDGLVDYVKADGSTVRVTPKQAAAWERKKK